jgi:hypothetical protein
MEPGDDTYVPGLLMSKATAIVGARRAAAFIVRREENNCETLHLFRHYSINCEDEATAAIAAEALRIFVIPCLMRNEDGVVEVPGTQDAAGKSYALVFLARDGTGVRGVTIMVVDCATRAEAERRLVALQRVMAE